MSIKSLLLIMLFTLSAGCTNDKSNKNTDLITEEKWSFVSWENCQNELQFHPCNFTLLDEKEDEISLYDFYEKNIVLDFSAMWCGPCKLAASEISEIKKEYPEIVYITVLVENEYGEQPTKEDLSRWIDTYGITEPVLAGNRDMISLISDEGWPITAWPTFFYITDEMVLEFYHPGYSSSTVMNNINFLVSDY